MNSPLAEDKPLYLPTEMFYEKGTTAPQDINDLYWRII